jgi:predicted methyltransferase
MRMAVLRLLLAAPLLTTTALAAGAGQARAAEAAPDAGLAQAIASPLRTPKFVARDAVRHPAGVLSFFGLRPDATVVEIWPGSGYWAEILAPYLHGYGTYFVALPGQDEEKAAATFRARMAAEPALFRRVKLTELSAANTEIAPPGTADFVLTFRNVHNWMNGGYAEPAFRAFYRALKPGGILGVEEHRGRTDKPQDPKGEDGYVRQDYTIALARQAGLELVGSSELNANPRDTKDYPEGVWTLPPSFALGAKDHDKYAAIGEADNFLLKFRKPLR